MRNRRPIQILVLLAIMMIVPAVAGAHNVSRRDATFVQANKGSAVAPFMYLGAKHMVTGYDHLLFHSLTLLGGVLGGIHANPYVIDAIIGFSVVYKAFDNMDGFKRFLHFQPNTRLAVLIFGLFHGFGLATKLQEFTLAQSGLVTNIVSFNVGVEIGQVLALTGVLIGLSYWRTRPGFLQHAFLTNTVLMVGGFILVGYQLTGYFVA